MSQVECKRLVTGYKGKPVCEPIDFKLNSGDYLCIVGENGSGKTTLVRTLLSLQPSVSGEIKFDSSLKGKIGYLPQQTETQRDFPASVKEIVLSGCVEKFSPFYSKSQRETAYKNMELVGISDLANRSFRELSGGQQQRVLLARALCATDKILLLDEPMSALDAKTTEKMYAQIDRLNKSGTTVIMVSHDIDSAVKYATHILHLGDTVFFGTTDEYLLKIGGNNNA